MYEQNVKIVPPHLDVFGVKAKTEAEIIAGLKEFNTFAILHMCTKLMLFLNSDNALNPQKQTELAGGLLNLETRKRLEDFIKGTKEPDSRIAIFHHAPVMMMVKLNLEYNDATGSDISDEASRTKFASLLISLTDLWLENERLVTNINDPIQRKRFAEGFRRYQARQFLQENDTEPMANLLVRGRYMLDKIRTDKRLTFETTFKDATGMELEMYMDILLMVMSQWTINVEMQKLDDLSVRSTGKFFKETTVSEEDIEKFLSIVGFKMDEYHDLNQTLLGRANMANDNNLVNFITFMTKPILRYDDKFMCMSPNFLLLQLTDGPYNIVREAIKGTKQESLLPEVWGEIYEGYIADRLSSIFGKNVYPNVKEASGNEVLDSLVDMDDVVLLNEIKYPHWSFRARITGKRDDIHSFMEKIARYNPKKERLGQPKVDKKKGLGQIKAFVEKVDKGTAKPPVDLSNKLLIPTLILGEEYPCDPLNRHLLEAYAASEGCLMLKDQRLLPFILLTSEDIELLEALVEEKGLDEAKKIFMSYVMRFHPKHRDPAITKQPTSFKNEVFNMGIKTRNSKFMKARLGTSFDPVRKYFKSQQSSMLPEQS